MAREIERRKHGQGRNVERRNAEERQSRSVQSSADSEDSTRSAQRNAGSEDGSRRSSNIERHSVQRRGETGRSEQRNSDSYERRGHGRRDDGRSRKKGGAGKVIALTLLILVAFFGILYAAGSWYFKDHFAYGTTVNGDDVFGMTVSEVESLLSDDMEDYQLAIQERRKDGSSTAETLKGTDIGLQITFDDTLDKAIAKQSGIGWIVSAVRGRDVELGKMVEYDADKWKTAVDALQCFKSSFIQEPEDAYITTEDPEKGVAIVEEVQGNKPIRENVEALLSEAVLSLQESVDLEDGDCYEVPSVLSTDQELTDQMAKYQKYADLKITYEFGENEEVLDGATICSWLVTDDSGELSVDPAQVEEFVASLRKKYDTIFRTHTFTTSYGETIEIEGGDYGWWMNYKQEEEDLLAMIEAGESGERTPDYYQTANSYGENDYGDTYIEANLTAQHLYYYVDGEVVLESDFVSGMDTESRRTPEGVYGITYKERFANLKGDNYDSPVAYWMPFNGNVGLHDATWRTRFGGSIYESSGSHGCLNLPCAVAKELYSMVTAGTPVIVYSLPGTESSSTTKQSSDDIAQTCIDAFDAIPSVSAEKKEEVLKWMREFYNQIGSSARSKVTNYDILKEAEASLKSGN